MKLVWALMPTLLVTGAFVGAVYLVKYIVRRFVEHK